MAFYFPACFRARTHIHYTPTAWANQNKHSLTAIRDTQHSTHEPLSTKILVECPRQSFSSSATARRSGHWAANTRAAPTFLSHPTARSVSWQQARPWLGQTASLCPRISRTCEYFVVLVDCGLGWLFSTHTPLYLCLPRFHIDLLRKKESFPRLHKSLTCICESTRPDLCLPYRHLAVGALSDLVLLCNMSCLCFFRPSGDHSHTIDSRLEKNQRHGMDRPLGQSTHTTYILLEHTTYTHAPPPPFALPESTSLAFYKHKEKQNRKNDTGMRHCGRHMDGQQKLGSGTFPCLYNSKRVHSFPMPFLSPFLLPVFQQPRHCVSRQIVILQDGKQEGKKKEVHLETLPEIFVSSRCSSGVFVRPIRQSSAACPGYHTVGYGTGQAQMQSCIALASLFNFWSWVMCVCIFFSFSWLCFLFLVLHTCPSTLGHMKRHITGIWHAKQKRNDKKIKEKE